MSTTPAQSSTTAAPAQPVTVSNQPPASQSRGDRNLTILGIGAILIALTTTSIGILVYHNSGDIYLDRSRPGYLPDPEEVEEEQNISSTYTYPENGPLDKSELEDYLKELKKINDRLKALANPYSASPLSDESLGIIPANPEASSQTTE